MKKVVLAERKQDKSQREVSKQTETIRDKTEGLAIVWNLVRHTLPVPTGLNTWIFQLINSKSQIYDDINVIESQLEICENGHSPEVISPGNVRYVRIHWRWTLP